MTKDEAIELIERIPYICTANMPSSKDRLEFYRRALLKKDPVQWIHVIKTNYICKNSMHGETMRILEEEYTARAKRMLHKELASALEIDESEVEKFINNYIDKNIKNL